MELGTTYTLKPGQEAAASSRPEEAESLAENTDAASQVAALNLPPAVLEAYKKKFVAFDLNKDGVITRREFMAVSKVFGYHMTHDEIIEIFGKTDTDDSGGITFDEFVLAMMKRAAKNKELEPIRAKLKVYDKRGRGYITADEAFPVLQRELGFDMNKTEALVDRYDKNRDYRLTLLEFREFQQRVEQLKATIVAGFREFDRNGDGLVDMTELRAAMAPRGFTDAQLVALMDKYDEDRDGALNYQEFAAFWDIPLD